jgi:hypothetical protein
VAGTPNQFDGTVARVHVIDPTGGPHPHAGDLGHEDGTGQPLAQHRDRIEQIEHHQLDDLPGGGVNEDRSVGAHREPGGDVECTQDGQRGQGQSAGAQHDVNT